MFWRSWCLFWHVYWAFLNPHNLVKVNWSVLLRWVILSHICEARRSRGKGMDSWSGVGGRRGRRVCRPLDNSLTWQVMMKPSTPTLVRRRPHPPLVRQFSLPQVLRWGTHTQHPVWGHYRHHPVCNPHLALVDVIYFLPSFLSPNNLSRPIAIAFRHRHVVFARSRAQYHHVSQGTVHTVTPCDGVWPLLSVISCWWHFFACNVVCRHECLWGTFRSLFYLKKERKQYVYTHRSMAMAVWNEHLRKVTKKTKSKVSMWNLLNGK